jgi:hypothetical protein
VALFLYDFIQVLINRDKVTTKVIRPIATVRKGYISTPLSLGLSLKVIGNQKKTTIIVTTPEQHIFNKNKNMSHIAFQIILSIILSSLYIF